MNKPIKIGLMIVGGIAAFFILAAVLLVTLVDPNEYKQEISLAVKEDTGRDLVFEGDIGFNFFPWVGLEVGPVALSNAPGFSPAEMVRINRAEANIRIIPLLSGNVVIGEVVLDGFTLNLAVNADGVSNWADLAEGDDKPGKPAREAKPGKGHDGGLESLSVEGVSITNANITYADLRTGKLTSVTDLNLVIGEVGDKLPTPFELTFRFTNDDPKIDTRPRLTGVTTFDQTAGTMQITDLAIDVLGINVTGKFFAKGSDFSGELTLAEFNPKTLMETLGMEPLVTADVAALTRLSADLKVNGTPDSASLEQLVVKLDDTTITTTGAVKNFNAPAITVETNIDVIDVDRYLPPKTDGGTAQSGEPADDSGPAQEPDLSALKELDLASRLTIGSLKAMNLRVTEILCQLRVKEGVATVKPFTAKLYDGTLSAQSVLDATGKLAAWTESAELRGVQAGPLLKDLVGKDHILGATVVKYNLAGAGLTPDAIKRTVTGTASFAFTDGAINGVNVAKMLRDTWNTLKGQPAAADEPARTDFAELLGSAVIQEGHITNNDLLMKSPLLRVTGKGWADMPKNAVDYLATVTVVGTLKGQDGASMEDLSGLPLPIKVHGSLDDPSFSLDPKALADALFKGTFKQGTKGLEDTLRQGILGGGSSSGTTSGSESTDKKKSPGDALKGLFQ